MGYWDTIEEDEGFGQPVEGDFGQPQASYWDQLEPSESDPWGLNTEPEWNLDFGQRFEAGVQESFATLWGGLGMMSDIVGLDSARDYTMNRSNELFEKAAAHDIQTTSFKDIDLTSVEGYENLAKFLTEGIIGVIPDIAGTMLGGAGAATGLAKLSGKQIVRKSLEEGAKKGLAKNLAKAESKDLVGEEAKEYAYKSTLAQLGGMAGVGGYTAATGAGGMYSTDYNMEGDETSPFAALGGGVAQGAVTLFNPFTKVLAGIAAKKGVANIGKMAIGESLEEVSQGGIEKLHLAGIDPNLTVEEIFSDPETYWQLAEAGVLGAFVGGVFGGVGSKLNSKEDAQDLIRAGEEAFPEVTVPEGPRDIKAMEKEATSFEAFMQDTEVVAKFEQDWKIAEAKLRRTNKMPADNAAIQAAMARGAEGVTPPATAKTPIAEAVGITPPAEPVTRLPTRIKKKTTIAQDLKRMVAEEGPEEVQDSLITQPTGMAIQGTAEQTSMSPEEVLIAREKRDDISAPKVDEQAVSTEPTKEVGYLLEGTPKAAIGYVQSYGNPTKVMASLREDADAYIKENPSTEYLIEENIKKVEEAVKGSRGIARDVKTGHEWKPYEIGGVSYGDWLQVEAQGKNYVMVKSPEHGNKFIITDDINNLVPIKGTVPYKTKREGKLAFEKALPSEMKPAKSMKGVAKPLAFTKTGEKDTQGIPLMKKEGKGISRSSDAKYMIKNEKPGASRGEFFLHKGDTILNEGLPFKSLAEATDAYKQDRVAIVKVKEKAEARPTVIKRKKTKVKSAKAERQAKRETAKAEIARQKDVYSKGIRTNKKDFVEIQKKTTAKDVAISSTTIDPTKLNAHPDISKRVANYIESYMEYLGVDSKGLYVMPLQKDTVSLPSEIPTDTVNEWNALEGVNGLYSSKNNVLGIRVEGRSDPEILDSLNHEIFHKFKFDIFDGLTVKEKSELNQAYDEWLKDIKGISRKGKENIDKIYSKILEPVRSKTGVGEADVLSKEDLDYLLNFDEFFATQGAKWAVQDQPSRSLASKVFAKVADFFWKVYSIYAKGAEVTHKPIEGFNKFMKAYMKDQASFKEKRREAIEFDFSGFDVPAKEVGKKSPIKKRSLAANKAFIASKAYKKAKTDRVVNEWTEKISKTIDDFIQPISERLGKIHIKLPVFMREMERKLNMFNNKNLREVKPYVEKFKKLDKDTQELLGLYLHNTNIDEDYKIAVKILKDNNMYEDYKKVEGMLDTIYDRSELVGLNIFKKKDHYFPRRVKDIKGLMKYINEEDVDAGPLNIIIENEVLSDVQKNEMLMQAINTNRLPESALKATTASNKRSINRVDAEMSKYYENHVDSLVNHIYESNQRIEARALLGSTNNKKLVRRVNKLSKQLKVAQGKKDTTAINSLTEAIEKDLRAIQDIGDATAISEDSVSSFLSQQGLKIGDKDQRLAIELIRSRLNQKGMHGLAGDIRNIGLITALGSPLNTLTQLGDLPWIIYKYGLKNASKGIFGKKEIDMEDLDLTQALKEFSQEGTSKYVDKVLKATGFEWMDQFAKRGSMQASLVEARGMSESAFVKKNTELYGRDRAIKMYKDIKAGKKTDDLIQYVFNQLSEIQPISLSEMPSKYLTAGNGRIFYSLKSYGMKQLSNIRREGLEEYKKGNKVGAFKNMMKLIPLLVLSNASIDELKDWILGKDEPFEDHVMDNLMKLAFMSRYTLDKGTRDGMASSIIKDLISPPGVRLADTFMKDIYNTIHGEKDATYKSMENIPLFGKLVYKRTTQGREKEFDMRRRKIREDIRSALKSGSSLNSIRSRIARYNRDLPKGVDRLKYSVIAEVRRDIRKKKIERLRDK